MDRAVENKQPLANQRLRASDGNRPCFKVDYYGTVRSKGCVAQLAVEFSKRYKFSTIANLATKLAMHCDFSENASFVRYAFITAWAKAFI